MFTNAEPHWPPLFQAIVANDVRRSELQHNTAAIPFCEYVALMRERSDFTRAAEVALAWNHNKGNVA